MSTEPLVLVAFVALVTFILLGPLGQVLGYRLRARPRPGAPEAREAEAARAAGRGHSGAALVMVSTRFSVGNRVRVGDRTRLASILAEWPYDNRLTAEQLVYAGRETVVTSVSVRPGGHVLYGLEDAPGLWHDACVDPGE